MFRITYLWLLLFFVFTPVPTWADDAKFSSHQDREAFAHEFAQVVINVLHDPKKAYADRKNLLRQSFAASVDIDWIARFVLGSAWRSANDEQRERYTKFYRKYLTEAYITNFAENPGKGIYAIKIFSVSDEENKDDFTVHTEMQLTNGQNLKVDYRVNEKDGHYKVRDIAIENVSLIVTHRAEFSAMANENGVDGVITKLQELLNQPAQEIKVSMK